MIRISQGCCSNADATGKDAGWLRMTTDFFGMKNQDAPQDEEVDTSG